MQHHREFAREWVGAWNSRDLERILAHYDEGVVLSSPRARDLFGKSDGMVHGKGELKKYFGFALTRMPDLHFTLDEVYSGVGSLVLEYHTKDGRHAAEFMAFGKNGMVSQVIAHYTSP